MNLRWSNSTTIQPYDRSLKTYFLNLNKNKTQKISNSLMSCMKKNRPVTKSELCEFISAVSRKTASYINCVKVVKEKYKSSQMSARNAIKEIFTTNSTAS